MTLHLFYKRTPISKSGYLFVSEARDNNYFLSENYKPLPSLPAGKSEEFLARYNRIIQSYLRINKKNKFFFSTPFSIRNTWQSSFYYGFENYERLKELKEGEVYFNSPEWYLWAYQNIASSTDFGDLKKAQIDLKKAKLLRFHMALQGVRFSLSRRSSLQKPPRNIKFFIASIWTPAGTDKWNKTARDPFYGILPRLLQEKSHAPAIIYHAEGFSETSIISHVPAHNIASFISLAGWVWIFFILLTFKVKPPKSTDFPKTAIERDINTSLSNQVPLSLISYMAARRLLKFNPDAEFITLYENNCWEQGILQAAREAKKNVTGFQHTSFSLSFLKMDNRIAEKILPDRIFTTGAEPARLLINSMGHDKNKINVAGSLRYEFLPLPIQKSINGKILVLLQGAPDDPLFLYFLSLYLEEKDVIVRSHPAWPIKTSLRFSMSRDSMQDDISKSRLAIYTGTTASFEALSLGIPVIHADIGLPFSADPLENLKGCCVKRTWPTGTPLKNTIAEIDDLSEKDKLSGFEMANRYIKNYFSEVNNIEQQVVHE